MSSAVSRFCVGEIMIVKLRILGFIIGVVFGGFIVDVVGGFVVVVS